MTLPIPHTNSVISATGPWTSLATHCDSLPGRLADQLEQLTQRRTTFVCAALPRARYAMGGFALLTDPQQRWSLPNPRHSLDTYDHPYTAWALPYEWLAARVASAGATETAMPALGLRFGHLEHFDGPASPAPAAAQKSRPDLSAAAPAWYRRSLAQIHAAIRQGNVYQINLTRSQSYRATRHQVLQLWLHAVERFRPAFAYLWNDERNMIACLSPEEFWNSDGHSLVTAPIKGTALDNRRELLSDKNQAEHTMIVDLERNDLHRICLPGTVQVPVRSAPTAYGGVEHLVSLVHGQLHPHMTLDRIVDALAPGGSITGAPKLAAINYIRKLERTPRGFYCGALALTLGTHPYRGFAALPIRTGHWRAGWMRYGSGGGITLDSDATTEYRELLRKQYWLQDHTRA